jgi:hypothetical protein
LGFCSAFISIPDQSPARRRFRPHRLGEPV